MGFHEFFICWQGNLKTETYNRDFEALAKKYGFIREYNPFMRQTFKVEDNILWFSCKRELIGLSHWWAGGETGMQKNSYALAYEIENYLKEENVKVIKSSIHYFTSVS